MQKRILWFILLLFAAVARSSSHAQNGLAERMLRVEKGLLPAVVVKGQSAGQALAERMQYFHVPGVSIAVINNGKLEWAKG